MRIEPSERYYDKPCSYVAVGCAYENIFNKKFEVGLPSGLKNDGYLSLNFMDKFAREILSIKKKTYFKRDQRIRLKDFLKDNRKKYCVCVLGHFLYVNNGDYWSFFENEEDYIVCVWEIEESESV